MLLLPVLHEAEVVVAGVAATDVAVAGVAAAGVGVAGVAEAHVVVADVAQAHVVLARRRQEVNVYGALVAEADVSGADVAGAEVVAASVAAADVVIADVAAAEVGVALVADAQIGQGVEELLQAGRQRQLRGGLRGPGVIAGHRRHISGPVFLVKAFNGGDPRRVEPQPIRPNQRQERLTVGRHRGRRHDRGLGGLEHAGHRLSLPGSQLGLSRGCGQKARIRRRRGGHRRRRRALPRLPG